MSAPAEKVKQEAWDGVEKAYTNIVDVMDADRHVVEERFLYGDEQLVLNGDG